MSSSEASRFCCTISSTRCARRAQVGISSRLRPGAGPALALGANAHVSSGRPSSTRSCWASSSALVPVLLPTARRGSLGRSPASWSSVRLPLPALARSGGWATRTAVWRCTAGRGVNGCRPATTLHFTRLSRTLYVVFPTSHSRTLCAAVPPLCRGARGRACDVPSAHCTPRPAATAARADAGRGAAAATVGRATCRAEVGRCARARTRASHGSSADILSALALARLLSLSLAFSLYSRTRSPSIV